MIVWFKQAFIFGLIAIFLANGQFLLVFATEFSSTNFSVVDPVIEGLSSYSTSTSFRVWATIPYISTQRSTSTSFINLPGFEAFVTPSATTTPSPTSTPPSVGGGTGFSDKLVGDSEILSRFDFNKDGRINFIDFSILLYYYDKTGDIIIPFDFNEDKDVDIVDISIFMYYWTGEFDEGINI